MEYEVPLTESQIEFLKGVIMAIIAVPGDVEALAYAPPILTKLRKIRYFPH